MVWPSSPLLISLVVTCGLWRRKHASAAVICIMPALYRFLYARFRRHIVVAQRYAARHNPHVALVISTLALRYQFILLSLFSVNDRFSSQTPLWQVLLIWGEFGDNLGTIWGQNFRLARNGVHPPDPLLTQFRKAPDSAELTCFCAPTCPSFA